MEEETETGYLLRQIFVEHLQQNDSTNAWHGQYLNTDFDWLHELDWYFITFPL